MLTFSTLLKKYIFLLFTCSWKCLWKLCLVCLIFFCFYLMPSHIFTNNDHNVLYVYLCTEALSKGNAINILYICKFGKGDHNIKFAKETTC